MIGIGLVQYSDHETPVNYVTCFWLAESHIRKKTQLCHRLN